MAPLPLCGLPPSPQGEGLASSPYGLRPFALCAASGAHGLEGLCRTCRCFCIAT